MFILNPCITNSIITILFPTVYSFWQLLLVLNWKANVTFRKASDIFGRTIHYQLLLMLNQLVVERMISYNSVHNHVPILGYIIY